MTLLARLLTAVFLVMVAGCAMTPAEVAATDPIRRIPIKTDIGKLTDCLMPRLENLAGPWTASHRTEGQRTTFRIHGGGDLGTIAVAVVEEGMATIHISSNILTPDALAGTIEQQILACRAP